LTAHLGIILDNDQLDAHLLYFAMRLLYSSTCFEHYILIIRRLNYIVSKWPSGATDGHLLRVTIPDGVSIQFNLLLMNVYCSKRVEDYNKRIVK